MKTNSELKNRGTDITALGIGCGYYLVYGLR